MELMSAHGFFKMKNKGNLLLFVTILGLFLAPALEGDAVTTTWSSEVHVGETYHWHVEKMNFHGTAVFNQSGLAGADNINVGDIAITIMTALPSDFDFIGGDRLELSITLEGDMIIESNGNHSRYHTDWHLFILPITVDGQNFFNLQRENKKTSKVLPFSSPHELV